MFSFFTQCILHSQARICLEESKLKHVSGNPIVVSELDENLIFSLSVQEVMAGKLFFSYIEHSIMTNGKVLL